MARRFKRPSVQETTAAIGDVSLISPVDRRAFTPNSLFHKQLPAKPPPGSWLSSQPETGQSYASYQRKSIRCEPHGHVDTMYLVPIGAGFDGMRAPKIADLEAYARAFFGCKVGLLKVSKKEQKTAYENSRYGDEGQRQLDAASVRDCLLKLKAPRDSFALIAVTMEDLYVIKNGEAWNFVFGQASTSDGVGVFSFARYDPSGLILGTSEAEGLGEMSEEEYQIMMRRCFRVLTHEGGHVLGLKHCIHFQCLLNGSNHLQESDAAPLHLCPLCLRKLQASCKFDPLARYEALLGIYMEQGFADDVAWLTPVIAELEEAATLPYEPAHAAKSCPLRRCQGKRGCLCPRKP